MTLRATGRAIARALASGPAGGAYVMLAAFVYDLAFGEVGFLGQRDARAVAMVLEQARWRAIREQLLILGCLLSLGCLFGWVGVLAGRAWDWALRRQPVSVTIFRGVVMALVAHAFFLARSIVAYPQLYSSHLYAHEGVRRSLMVFLTRRLTLGRLDVAVTVILFAAFVLPFALRPRDVSRWMRANLRLVVGVPVTIAAGALAIAAIRQHRRRSGNTRADRPNVLLVAIDSLRADRVLGPDAGRFPTLARLAQQGVRFDRAFVTHARTLPSFVTLLTGRYPQHHGIRHEFPTEDVRAAIGPSITAAARDVGWYTAAVSDFAGEIFARVQLGIDDVDVARFNLYAIVEGSILNAHLDVLPYAASPLGDVLFPSLRAMAEYADPQQLVDRANERLDAAAGRPFFVTVFFSGTHSPYVAPAPFYGRFGDPEYSGPFRYLKEPLPLFPSLPERDAVQVRALYDGSLAAIDDALARLLRRLDEDGTAKNTIVVLLGDHGENLFDVAGRGMGHGDHLLGELANHIPLVIVDGRATFAPHDVPGIVRDVDLAPTLAGLLGVTAPPTDGTDLAPMLRGERSSLDLEAYAETGLWFIGSGPGFGPRERMPYPDVWHASAIEDGGDIFLEPRWEQAVLLSKHRSLRTPRWNLLYQPTLAGPRWSLFDVVADPQEQVDVASLHPAEFATLRAKLEVWIESDGRSSVQPDDWSN